MSTVSTRPPQIEDAPATDHWTADEFYRAVEAGEFEDPGQLELIHGRIIEKMPQSPRHTALVGHIAKRLRAALSETVTVRTEAAIHIAFDGEPIPDVSVVRGDDLDYLTRHATPEDLLLLVEVALSSEEYDLGLKALLYAQAGVADYWVVLPEQETVVVHRGPTPEGYQTIETVGPDATLAPLPAEDVTLWVRDLLGLRDLEARE